MGAFIEFLDIFLIIAAAQGFFLSVLLIHNYRNFIANRFISAFTALYSLVLINLILVDLKLFENWNYLIVLTEGIQFLIFPLFYLYAKYLISGIEAFQFRDIWHASFFIIYKFLQIPVIFDLTIIDPVNFQNRFLHVFLNWSTILIGIIYFSYTLILIAKYSKTIHQVFSTIEHIRLNWLRWMTILLLLIILLFLIENITDQSNSIDGENFELTSLLAAIYSYAFAYTALAKSTVFSDKIFLDEIHSLKEENTKYQKSGLKSERAEQLIYDLETIMNSKKIFLNNGLTLGELASHLGVSSHNLSEVISRKLNTNFFDYINRQRINEIKKRFADPEFENYTILAIGLDSGFNSKSAINSLVKKYTGQTPSQLRESIKRKQI